MSKFNISKLESIKRRLSGQEKVAFVPAPLMQQKISEAQQAGAIPPPPAPPQDPNAPQGGQPEPTLNDVMGMMQEGFNAVLQTLQQIGQMMTQQQQMGGPAGDGPNKKMSNTDRIAKLEEMLMQMSGGGGAPPPGDPGMAGGAPPPPMPPQGDPNAAAQQPPPMQ